MAEQARTSVTAGRRSTGRISLTAAAIAHAGAEPGEERQEYANNLELLLTLVGYAVGLGNIWRFPYLCFENGGGAFLIPYFLCLALLGIPLFILEMGLGQTYRQGTLGIWPKIGLYRMQGVGIAATTCTFMVMLYYNVILAWTVYYMSRTIMAMPSGILPWTDQAEGFVCPPTVVFANKRISNKSDVFDPTTGLYNQAYAADFWCPKAGLPTATMNITQVSLDECMKGAKTKTLELACKPTVFASDYATLTEVPKTCPARAAASFWEEQALQQTSGMNVLGGPNWGLTASLTFSWILVYFIIFKGVASSGKVVYVTAILPYIALVAFFIRANTLDGAGAGLIYYLKPDLTILANPIVWIRAATQIFYSLGVGFGALIAFSSYSSKTTNFVKQSCQVACINCGTSFFAGFVVFPILGYLCLEISETNPCIDPNNLKDLKSIGLSGTGLAFIAFPIAISRMPFPFFWAMLFFVMLFCLGIDSQFAMVESVCTVLDDAKIGQQYSKATRTAILCVISWFIGLIFVTKGGVYWFNLFDNYSCVVAMFFVCFLECLFMWVKPDWWPDYKAKVKAMANIDLSDTWLTFYKFVVPTLIFGLLCLVFKKFDIMDARKSKPYPEGTGLLPEWSIYVGWFVGLLPLVGFAVGAMPYPYTPETMPASAWQDVGSSSNLKPTANIELLQSEEATRY